MTDNNTTPESNEQHLAEGYNQTPYDPAVTPPEPYHVTQRRQPPINPFQHQQYPPKQTFPVMRPKTLEDIRQEKILFNTIGTAVIGTGFASFMFACFGFLGCFITALATAFMTYRSVKLGGGYIFGLSLTLINILGFYLFLFVFTWAFQMSGVDFPTFLDQIAEAADER